MSELEKIYRDAPRLRSPARLDAKILQSAHEAARVSAGRTIEADPIEAEKRRSLLSWKPGLALASVCTVGIGLGVAMQAGWHSRAPTISDIAQLETQASREEKVALSVAADHTFQGLEASADVVSESEVADTANASDLFIVQKSESTVAEASEDAVSSISAETMAATAASSTEILSEEIALQPSADVVTADSDAMGEAEGDDIRAERYRDREVSTKQAPRQMHKQTASAENTVALAAPPMALGESRSEKSKSFSDQVEVNRWLMAQNSENYTIKLTVAKTELALDAVAEKFKRRTEKAVGADAQWLLLHGSFTQRHQAELAQTVILNDAERDGSLGDLVPKIVRIGEVQQLLK